MITERDSIDSSLEQRLGNAPGDASPGGRVLPVGDDKIQPVLGPQSRHAIQHDVPPGPTHDVADESKVLTSIQAAHQNFPSQR